MKLWVWDPQEPFLTQAMEMGPESRCPTSYLCPSYVSCPSCRPSSAQSLQSSYHLCISISTVAPWDPFSLSLCPEKPVFKNLSSWEQHGCKPTVNMSGCRVHLELALSEPQSTPPTIRALRFAFDCKANLLCGWLAWTLGYPLLPSAHLGDSFLLCCTYPV